MLNNKIKLLFVLVLCVTGVHAQIGYQVALLNAATGKPRANVTVNAEVTITNAQDEVVYSNTQKVTSNDFGVLSFTIGDADTFQNTDTGKLPFYIAVKVDGVLIGKSQILNVPVAEVAKTLKSSFTKDDLLGVWKSVFSLFYGGENVIIFNSNGIAKMSAFYADGRLDYECSGIYEIEGNNVYFLANERDGFVFRYYNGSLYIMNDFRNAGIFHKISIP